jgi:uncharacterized membrane protein YedE/YeeE
MSAAGREQPVKKDNYWSPYLTGTMLGLTLLASFYGAGRGLGASGAFSLASGVGVNAVAPGYARGLSYFSRYLDLPQPLLDWGLFLIAGVFLGALAGALASRNFKFMLDKAASMTVRTRLFTAFFGGVLIGFASRLARGCTSGVALTGGSQLALAGWVFVIAMFASGFLFAALFRRYWS